MKHPRFTPLKFSTFQHVEKFSTVELLNFYFSFYYMYIHYNKLESTPEE